MIPTNIKLILSKEAPILQTIIWKKLPQVCNFSSISKQSPKISTSNKQIWCFTHQENDHANQNNSRILLSGPASNMLLSQPTKEMIKSLPSNQHTNLVPIIKTKSGPFIKALLFQVRLFFPLEFFFFFFFLGSKMEAWCNVLIY